jgi:hypothetical protein
MSKFSHEHHFYTNQNRVIEAMGSFFLIDQDGGVIDVTCAEATKNDAGYLISPTDASGWTVMWSSAYGLDEEIVAFISRHTACDALYGHRNDSVDNWKWMQLHNGVVVGEYHYVGQTWVRYPDRAPAEALTLSEAFRALGRTYHHLSFSGALSDAYRELNLPREKFRLLRPCGFTVRT